LIMVRGKYDRVSMGVTAVGCGIFAPASWYMAVNADEWSEGAVFGYLGVVVLAAFGVLAARAFFDPNDVLVIDQEGVLDRRSTDRMVPWSEIRGLRIWRSRLTRVHYVDVGDPVDRYTDGLLKKAWLIINQAIKQGVVVNANGLNVSFEKVDEALRSGMAAVATMHDVQPDGSGNLKEKTGGDVG